MTMRVFALSIKDYIFRYGKRSYMNVCVSVCACVWVYVRVFMCACVCQQIPSILSFCILSLI